MIFPVMVSAKHIPAATVIEAIKTPIVVNTILPISIFIPVIMILEANMLLNVIAVIIMIIHATTDTKKLRNKQVLLCGIEW